MADTAVQSVRMSAEEYFAAPGLSHSGMKDLAVSPLRYWYLHLNPDRPQERTTPEMTFGSALHCAVLEPEEFECRYTREIAIEDYPGCLRTMDDLRGWLKDKGLPITAKVKAELIDRVANADPEVPILDLIEQRHASRTAGMTELSKYDWQRVTDAAGVLRSQPKLRPILADGEAEVCFFARDPETGVPLKSRMDWVTPTLTLDLKTFSQMRGKSIDKSVHDAIFYEAYYRQAFFYTMVRSLQPGGMKMPFVMAFVESEPPHEARIKRLQSTSRGETSVYWQRARIEVEQLIRTFAVYMKEFGDRPWITPQAIEALTDEDMPQLAY